MIDLDALKDRHDMELVSHALRVFGNGSPRGESEIEAWVEVYRSVREVRTLVERIRTGLPPESNFEEPSRYNGTIRLVSAPEPFRTGMVEPVTVAVKNESNTIWETTDDRVINASYHWRDCNGQTVLFEGLRTPLPFPVRPREEVELPVRVAPPNAAGRYELFLTLVHEGVTWFEESGFRASGYETEVEWALPASTLRVLDEIRHVVNHEQGAYSGTAAEQ